MSGVHYLSEEMKNFESVGGSEGACGWEWGSVLMVVAKCVADSGGVYNWERRSVWLGAGECITGSGECVAGSGRVSGWE